MTDHNTSGADFAPGAAPTGQAPASFAETGASGASQPIGAFGSVRGSGLARGKRTSNPAASAAPAAKSDGYKPTALEVIVPQNEYKNPFTGETAAAAPVEAPAAPVAPVAPVIVFVTVNPVGFGSGRAVGRREYITPQPAEAQAPAAAPADALALRGSGPGSPPRGAQARPQVGK